MATYLYILCQALDIHALQSELYEGLDTISTEELSTAFAALSWMTRASKQLLSRSRRPS